MRTPDDMAQALGPQLGSSPLLFERLPPGASHQECRMNLFPPTRSAALTGRPLNYPGRRLRGPTTLDRIMPTQNTPTSRTAPTRQRLQAAKLLRSKWTAATPLNKEKHFIVTALIEADPPGTEIDMITLEAVLTQRSFTLRWRELNDSTRWLQGWR
jgi:tryptophan-rich hypothetical protein